MKVSAVTSLLVALAAVTSASPLEERDAAPQVQAAAVTTAVVWTDVHFRGQSRKLQRPAGQCGGFSTPPTISFVLIKKGLY